MSFENLVREGCTSFTLSPKNDWWLNFWIHDGFLDSQWVPGLRIGSWIHDGFLDSRWVLHPQEGGRLDAKRHYVILAKALDGIWPVGHACAVLC